MGVGGISIWQLLIILLIVVMVFGTKKLRNMGGDLGSAVKGFKKAVKDEANKNSDDEDEKDKEQIEDQSAVAAESAKTGEKEKA